MSSPGMFRVAGIAALFSLPLSSPVISDDYGDYAEAEYRNWDLGVGATAGTLGIGIEVSTKLTDMIVLRATGTGLSTDYDGTYAGAAYAWDTDIVSFGLTADLHPFGNNFRLSAGLRYLYADFDGRAKYAATYNIGGQSYLHTEVGGLTARKNINTVAPYVGFGFDSTHYESALSFGVDIGALYLGDEGTRVGTLRAVPGLAEDLAREAQEGSDDEWFKKIYPVVMFSMKYRF